ncbi:MAG: DNA repair protein RecO [Lachnospiraceae bacterium]|nr:DNA repair protein RecO [Lachnospiraceae bacterium]
MSQEVTVTGMILSAGSVGDYDMRIVILTKERGRISSFARGAKRLNNPFGAICQPFTFGEFILYEGRTAYNLKNAKVMNYFSRLKQDLELIYYGSYFCEFASYLTRENSDELHILKLLYQTMRILEKGTIPLVLVRSIYEIKLLAFYGYGMESFRCIRCGSKENLNYFNSRAGGALCSRCAQSEKSLLLGESTLYTIQYIISSPVEKLFTFTVSSQVMRQLKEICSDFIHEYIDYKFKSLDFLDIKY